MPLLQTLAQLLQNDNIQKELQASQNQDATIYSDFSSGSVWEEHPLFSDKPEALQIVANYDELEIVNPIGSYVIYSQVWVPIFQPL